MVQLPKHVFSVAWGNHDSLFGCQLPAWNSTGFGLTLFLSGVDVWEILVSNVKPSVCKQLNLAADL